MANESKKRGFYIALSVCILAVFAAGWSTYKSVIDFATPPSTRLLNKTSEKPEKKEEIPKKDVSKEKIPVPSKNDKEISSVPEKDEIREVSSASMITNMISPIENGKISNEYSKGKLVKSELKDWRTHDGIDISGNQGSEVRSMSSGKVIDIFSDENFGQTIVVEHEVDSQEQRKPNKLKFYYSGVDKDSVAVEKNQNLASGQVIGKIGIVPIENQSPHLHLAIKNDKQFVNPLDVIPSNTFDNEVKLD